MNACLNQVVLLRVNEALLYLDILISSATSAYKKKIGFVNKCKPSIDVLKLEPHPQENFVFSVLK